VRAIDIATLGPDIQVVGLALRKAEAGDVDVLLVLL